MYLTLFDRVQIVGGLEGDSNSSCLQFNQHLTYEPVLVSIFKKKNWKNFNIKAYK